MVHFALKPNPSYWKSLCRSLTKKSTNSGKKHRTPEYSEPGSIIFLHRRKTLSVRTIRQQRKLLGSLWKSLRQRCFLKKDISHTRKSFLSHFLAIGYKALKSSMPGAVNVG